MTRDEGIESKEQDWLDTAREIAREAGRLLQARQGRVAVRSKGPRDLVTEADLEAQSLIRRRLQDDFPDHRFLGEEVESGAAPRSAGRVEDGFLWVVDPLDGTMNYVHGMPHFAVSIALLHRRIAQVGVIYQPAYDQLFWATRGGGAWLNDTRMQCSECRVPEDALLAVSLAARVARNSVEVDQLERLLESVQGVRRLGSAALNLAYVAAGWFDGYWARHGNLWDVAAGWLLVSEAGGTVWGLTGQPFDVDHPHLVAAGTRSLAQALIERVENGPA